MRTVTVVVLLAALGARRVGAQATTTTVAVTSTTTSTTTTLPPTLPSTLCTCNANHVCEVKKGTYPVTPGSNLDFGTCALTLDSGATVALTTGAGSGVTIEAASLTMNANATIQGSPKAQAPNDGGYFAITVTGAILLDAGATISVDAEDAGTSEIDLTAGGPITLEGGAGTNVLSARALSSGGDGGILNVLANGDVTIDAALSVASGDQGGGGDICITTNNAKVTVNGPLDASGGEFDGGCIDVESDLDLMATAAAKLKVDGGGLSGSGGQIILDANVQGPVTIDGPVSGKAAGSNQNSSEGGGDGGELDSFTTNGSVTVNGQVDLPGGTGGGGGGTVDIEPTGDLIVDAALSLPGSGNGSCGGSATLGAVGTSNVTLSTNAIDVSSDSCGGGGVFLSADDTAMVAGEINADSNGTQLGGGSIQLLADTLTVGGKLHASGGGGEVNLQACSLTLAATGQTVATGPNGFNLLQASGPMEIEGTMTATVANTLDYLDPAHLPVVQSSNVSPPAVIVDDNPAVPPLCPGQTIPTSTTSTISTTSTTIGVTTSTTVPTTTTLVVGTTTSTSTTTTTTTKALSPTTSARSSTSTTSTTSSTVVASISSTTVAASTTSTVTVPRSTTTTIPAPPCSGQPTTFDAASCSIQLLTDTVETTTPTALGGSRTAHRLGALLKQADHALDSVEHGTRVKASLRKTRRALNTFEVLVHIGLKRQRGAIEPEVGQLILRLAVNATTSIGEMQARIH
jgi:hypothetical protein